MNKIKLFLKSKFYAALCAGAFCALAFAPFHFFIAAPISLSVFYFLLEKTEPKKPTFWLGFCYGFGYFLAGNYWIAISLLVDAAKFFWLVPFALTLIPSALALYVAAFALSYKFLIKKFKFAQNYQKILVFALCWLIFEILRSLLFTGFPWNLLGYIWMFEVHFAQLGGVFGIYGLSFFAVLISLLPTLFFKGNSSLSLKWTPQQVRGDNGERSSQELSPRTCCGVHFATRADKIFALTLITAFFANFIYGYFYIDDSKLITTQTKLRLVQGNIKQEMKWDPSQKYKNFLKHIELTNSKDLSDIKAVIWSETAVPYAIDSNQELLEKLGQATPPQGVLITGALHLGYSFDHSEITNAWNSVFTFNQKGVLDIYDKHHLVPFGEYVPLQKYLPFIEKITDGAIGFSQGQGPKTITTPDFSFSPLLCYEVIFSDEAIDLKSRPDLLVNVTNDAWFGVSTGPYQHFDMARMRTIEYGIALARVANTGVTAFVDPFGRVVDKINLNQSGIIDVNLIKNLAPTIYEKYRYYPLMLLVLAVVLFLTFSPKSYNVTRQNHTS